MFFKVSKEICAVPYNNSTFTDKFPHFIVSNKIEEKTFDKQKTITSETGHNKNKSKLGYDKPTTQNKPQKLFSSNRFILMTVIIQHRHTR